MKDKRIKIMDIFILFLICYYVFSLFFCYGASEDTFEGSFWEFVLQIFVTIAFCWLFMPLILGNHFKDDF